jgi:hypothetical protein
MRRFLACVSISVCVACGEPADGSSPAGCQGARTDNLNGTTTIACADGTRELVCSRPDCSGISSMSITGTDLARVVLPTLRRVDMLYISVNANLTTIRLPALTGDWLVVWGNPSLTVLDVPALETLRPRATEPYRCAINGNASLATLTLPALASADLDIRGNAALKSVSMPALEEAGTLELAENYALRGLSMPALAAVRDLRIWANPALQTVDVSALRTVTGDLQITANSSYPQCAAEAIVAQLVGYVGVPSIMFNDTTATCP